MPGRSKRADDHRHAAEEHRKMEEDLDRASQDLKKKMGEHEKKGAAKSKTAKPKAKVVASNLRGARWIESTGEHEEHPGQSLATQNHDVIKQWAERRKAQPATVGGHQGRPGVLRFNFPGYGGGGLEAISWEEWFRTFDGRELTFLYQEHLKNGNESNFFKLTSPHRKDG